MQNSTRTSRWTSTVVIVAAAIGCLLAGTGHALAEASTDPPVDQTLQQESRDSAAALSPMRTDGFQDDFIAAAGPAAQAVMAEYRVPASVGTAQAILESNWGRSGLSVNDKNYFGFKCVSAGSPGPIAIGCHAYQTQECTPTCHTVTAYFRVYATMTDSFRDYGRLLSTSSLYAPAFQYVNDPDQFAREIARHYATDPDYANKVIGLMVNWNLYRFNAVARGSSLSGDGRAEVVSVQSGEARAWYNAAGFAPMPWAGDNVVIATGFTGSTTKFADLDGDGKSEILAVNTVSGEVRAWHNVAGFAPMPWAGDNVVVASGVTDPNRVLFADLDGDRRAEVIAIESDGTVRAWHNVAGFAAMPWGGDSVVIATGFTPANTFLTDLDSDGKSDIVHVSPNGEARAWHNVAGFAAMPWGGDNVVIGTGMTGPTTKFADLDGDGKSEILAVNTATGEVRAWHNVAGFAPMPWAGDNVVVATGVTDPSTVHFA